MRSKILLPFIYTLFLLIPAFSFAQDATTQIADKTCTCLNERLNDEVVSTGQTEMILGLCMIEATAGHEKELKKKHGIDVANLDDYEKLGEIIGVELVGSCPKFMEVVVEMMQDEEYVDELVEESVNDGVAGESEMINGTIEKVELSDFVKLTFNPGGTAIVVYIMGSFDGMEDISRKEKQLEGRNVDISYREKRIYSPWTGRMETIKELTAIRLN